MTILSVRSDVYEFCDNNSTDITHVYTSKRDEIANDTSTLRSNTEFEMSVNNCTIVESNDVNEHNVDDEIENTILHVDGNIDAGRLRSVEMNERSIVNVSHIFIELQKISTHWLGE